MIRVASYDMNKTKKVSRKSSNEKLQFFLTFRVSFPRFCGKYIITRHNWSCINCPTRCAFKTFGFELELNNELKLPLQENKGKMKSKVALLSELFKFEQLNHVSMEKYSCIIHVTCNKTSYL